MLSVWGIRQNKCKWSWWHQTGWHTIFSVFLIELKTILHTFLLQASGHIWSRLAVFINMPYRGPPPLSTMTCVHDFIVDLAHAGQDAKTILKLCQAAHGDNALSQVYRMLADVKAGKDVTDKRNQNAKKTKRTKDLIKAGKVFVEQDGRVTVEDISREVEASKPPSGGSCMRILALSRSLQDGSPSSSQRSTRRGVWSVQRLFWRAIFWRARPSLTP